MGPTNDFPIEIFPVCCGAMPQYLLGRLPYGSSVESESCCAGHVRVSAYDPDSIVLKHTVPRDPNSKQVSLSLVALAQ